MQLTTRHNNVSSNGNIGEQSSFGIAVNAKMFRVLSDTMYTNKIGSIVRELSSNALDGHTKAGTPEVPFTIHVPNVLEPWFSVKDTGVGMSDEDIRTVYTTYGSSTKDQSNNEVGAFGLGAKTPFAYTDQFTITSIHAGVSRTYVAVIADDGMPVLNMQAEAPTTEPNGVEVTIAVERDDIRAFNNEIQTQLKFFKVKPVLTNNMEELEWKDISERIEYDDELATIYDGSYSAPIQKMYVIQGGVGYPINISNLGNLDKNVSDFAKGLEYAGVLMEFPIGDISVTASRESISYEPKTIDTIVKRITAIATKITSEIAATIRKEPHQWNRMAIFNSQMDVVKKAILALPDASKLFDKTFADNRFGNKMSLKAEQCQDGLGYELVELVKFSYRSRGSYTNNNYRMKQEKIASEGRNSYSGCRIYPTPETKIFILDKCSKFLSRLRKYVNDNDYPSTIVVKAMDKEYDLPALAKALGVDVNSFVMVSTLEAEVTVRGSGGGNTSVRPTAYVRTRGMNRYETTDWDRSYDDLDDMEDTVYIKMHRNNVENETGWHDFCSAADGGFIKHQIVAVNAQMFDKIKAGKVGANLIHWTELLPEVKEVSEKVDAIGKVYSKYKGFVNQMESRSTYEILSERSPEWITIRQKVEAMKVRMEILINRTKDHGWAGMDVNVYDSMTAGRDAASAWIEKGQAKYPMLKYVGNIYHDTDMGAINDYIDMVNKTRQGA